MIKRSLIILCLFLFLSFQNSFPFNLKNSHSVPVMRENPPLKSTKKTPLYNIVLGVFTFSVVSATIFVRIRVAREIKKRKLNKMFNRKEL
jgi:hypothetical protein